MFPESVDDEQIVDRVATLDIDKAELVCCVCGYLPQLATAGGSRR